MQNNNHVPSTFVPSNTGYQYNMLPPPSSPPPYDIGQAFPMLVPMSMGMTPLPPPPLPPDDSIPRFNILKPSPFASTKKRIEKEKHWEEQPSKTHPN